MYLRENSNFDSPTFDYNITCFTSARVPVQYLLTRRHKLKLCPS